MQHLTTIPSVSGTLASRAMVVSLTISQWSGRRLDREITDEVNQQHNAAADAGRYNKLLLPKEALAGIVSVVSETRNEFLKRTLPWMDNGSRIMAADAYLAHMSWMRGQAAKFHAAVDDFIWRYAGYLNDARTRLNGMSGGQKPTGNLRQGKQPNGRPRGRTKLQKMSVPRPPVFPAQSPQGLSRQRPAGSRGDLRDRRGFVLNGQTSIGAWRR